jgi:hypothetical protein
MTDEKRAELYTSPGGRFIRADSPGYSRIGGRFERRRNKDTS